MNRDAEERQNQRKAEFKKGIGATDGVDKRTKHAEILRKKKRDAKLAQRRRQCQVANNEVANLSTNQLQQNITTYMAMVHSKNTAETLQGLQAVRRFCQSGNDPAIIRAIATQKDLKRYAQIAGLTKQQFTDHICCALDILTELARHDDVLAVFWDSTNAAATALKILQNKSAPLPVRHCATWLIGNIIGADDGEKYRDFLTKKGAAEALVANLSALLGKNILPDKQLTPRDDLLWALSNCYKGRKSPDFQLLAKAGATKLLGKCLAELEDVPVLEAVLWTIAHGTDHHGMQKMILAAPALLKRVCDLTGHYEYSIRAAATRVISNVGCYPEQANADIKTGEVMLKCGLAQAITTGLGCTETSIRENATFTVSNVIVDHEEYLRAFLEAGIIETIFDNATCSTALVQAESIRCAAAAMNTALQTHGQVERETLVNNLLAKGIMSIFMAGLKFQSASVQLDVCGACEGLLRVSKESVVFLFEDEGLTEEFSEVYLDAVSGELSDAAERVCNLLSKYGGEDDNYDKDDYATLDSLMSSGGFADFAQHTQGDDQEYFSFGSGNPYGFSGGWGGEEVNDDNDNDNNNNNNNKSMSQNTPISVPMELDGSGDNFD